MLERWQTLLRLDDFEGACRRISQWQVTDEDGTIGQLQENGKQLGLTSHDKVKK